MGGTRLRMHDAGEFALSRRPGAVFDRDYRSSGAGVVAHDQSEFALSGWVRARFDSRHRVLDGQRRPAASPSIATDYVVWTEADGAGVRQVRAAPRNGGTVETLSSGAAHATDLVVDGPVVRFRSERGDAAPGAWRFARLGGGTTDAPLCPLPTICCWGDSMTQQGYPASLAAVLGVTVHNFGISSQPSSAVAARFAPRRYTVAGGAIPASGAVALSPNDPGPVGNFAGNAGNIGVTIAGVRGTFAYDPSTGVTFTRAVAGAAVPAPGLQRVVVDPVTTDGTAITVADYRDRVTVIRVGRNNITRPQLILDDVARMVAYLRPLVARYVIWPVYNARDEKRGTAAYALILDINRALRAAYPSAYLQVGAVDARENLVALASDAADTASDIIPARLLVADGLHTNADGRQLDAEFCATFLRQKGWFQ